MPRRRRGWGLGGGLPNQESHTPLIVSMLEPALLILLKEHPRHGYMVLADLEGLGMGTIHPSVVYRTLRELEGLEWVQSDWENDQSQGPPRRTYQLTPQGDAALEFWQRELGKTRDLISHLIDRIK